MLKIFKRIIDNKPSQKLEILRNYFTSILNLFLRMASNLIVIPFLSQTPSVLAIYSICISLSLFFKSISSSLYLVQASYSFGLL